MSKIKLLFFLSALGIFAFTGCTDDDEVGVMELAITGLEDLGANYAYEGWIIVDGSAKTSGVFTVDDAGNLSQTSFDVNLDDLNNASEFVLTIEPSPDNSADPSSVHIMGGAFSGNSASITVGHSSALGSDFTAATGSYILATPTDGAVMDENSGVWWLDPAAGPGPGLDLPVLPDGWKYEGWAVVDGTPLTTGKFTSATGADESAPFSGSTPGPDFPGEDFLMNAPSGLTFPTDLAGMTVVVSVEPEPDNSANPFLLKPLVGQVPATAVDHTSYLMDNNAAATNPTGTVSR